MSYACEQFFSYVLYHSRIPKYNNYSRNSINRHSRYQYYAVNRIDGLAIKAHILQQVYIFSYQNNANILVHTLNTSTHSVRNNPSSSFVSSRLELFERQYSVFYGEVRSALHIMQFFWKMADNRECLSSFYYTFI